MSNRALAEDPQTATDAEVIAEMATAVLATIARLHADGLTAVTTIAETPVRLELPPVAEAPAPVEAALTDDEPTEDEPVEDAPVEAGPAQDEPAAEDVVRISEPLWVVPPPRGRHLAEALTDQLPAQHVA
ncbi:hypothetical protein [Modestobacter lacusdianchii]